MFHKMAVMYRKIVAIGPCLNSSVKGDPQQILGAQSWLISSYQITVEIKMHTIMLQ